MRLASRFVLRRRLTRRRRRVRAVISAGREIHRVTSGATVHARVPVPVAAAMTFILHDGLDQRLKTPGTK